MDRAKKRQIEWFLTFLNTDFDGDPLEVKLNLLRATEIPLATVLPTELSTFQSTIMVRETAEAELLEAMHTFKGLQGRVKQLLKTMFQKLKEAERYEGKDGPPLLLSEIPDLRSLWRSAIEVEVMLRLKEGPELKRQEGKQDEWRPYWRTDALKKSPLEVVITPKKGDLGFLFFFAQALDGIPLSYIKQCTEPTCSKWFLQSGRRERLFCSDKCRASMSSKKRSGKIKERAYAVNSTTY